jgi:hypothetical protein
LLPLESYSHVFGVYMAYESGLGFDDRNLLDLYTTCYDISQNTAFDSTISTSDHTTLIDSCLWTVSHC